MFALLTACRLSTKWEDAPIGLLGSFFGIGLEVVSL